MSFRMLVTAAVAASALIGGGALAAEKTPTQTSSGAMAPIAHPTASKSTSGGHRHAHQSRALAKPAAKPAPGTN